MMDVAFEFSFSSMNMDFAIHLTCDSHPVPEGLFVDINDVYILTRCITWQLF